MSEVICELQHQSSVSHRINIPTFISKFDISNDNVISHNQIKFFDKPLKLERRLNRYNRFLWLRF